MTRYMKRDGKVWIKIFPHNIRTKKPLEVRMGSGKGAPDGYVAVVKDGTIMFEIGGVSEEIAREALRLAEKKTPAGKLRDLSVAEIKTKIAELKQELFNLRFQAEVGKLENTAQLKKVKKEIARCYTVLTERENTK